MDLLTELSKYAIIIGLVIAVFSSYLSRFGVFLVSHTTLMPERILKFIRVKKWGYRRTLLTTALNPAEVTWHSVRSYARMLLFVGTCFFYLCLISFGPLKGFGQLPIELQAFISSPIYIFEILWLIQREFTKDLIQVVGIRRVTNQLTARRLLRRNTI